MPEQQLFLTAKPSPQPPRKLLYVDLEILLIGKHPTETLMHIYHKTEINCCSSICNPCLNQWMCGLINNDILNNNGILYTQQKINCYVYENISYKQYWIKETHKNSMIDLYKA